MSSLNIEQIMTVAPGVGTRDVEIPEWGGSIKIKGFTRAEITAMRKRCTVSGVRNGKAYSETDNDLFEQALVLEGVIEPKLTKDHWVELNNRQARPIERILKALLQETGLTEEEAAETRADFPPEGGAAV